MKKRVIATFLTILMLMAILAGCGDSASKPAEDASSVGTEVEDIKWPEKSINFIMGFKAGGGADITARALFQPYVENVLGQKFVFNYMEGSNGEISYTTLMLENCSENERAYAEQLLKTFVAAMNMKDEEKALL